MDGAAADFPGNLLRSGPESVRLWRPARMLSSFADLLPHGGRALDLACGSGRNAAFLALRGADALGVDLLPDALRQARTLARASGLRAVRTARRRVGQVAFRRADLTDARVVARLLPPGRWQAITCFRYLDRALLPRIAGALAPGGVLFYQTFLEAQARLGRKPRRPAFLLKPGELRRAFASLEIIHYEEGPDERGDHHASLVARAAGPERR
jgi:SAM-dependent methyltransferase